MEINTEVCGGTRKLRIAGDMTIYGAGELKKSIIESVSSGGRTELDLSQVDEIDTAGVQLLILAVREARLLGKELGIISASSAVASILKLYNLLDFLAVA